MAMKHALPGLNRLFTEALRKRKRTHCLGAVPLLLSGLLILAGCTASEPAAEAPSDPAAEEEEVNIGYGTQDRRDMTAAVGTLSAEEQRKNRSVNHLSDLLRGSVAGVQVSEGTGGGIVVRIRGTSSIYGSNDPLYVVDGMAVQAAPGGALPWINPHDVKSISVLKDAAATSIYGSRGANGVIVVEMKK